MTPRAHLGLGAPFLPGLRTVAGTRIRPRLPGTSEAGPQVTPYRVGVGVGVGDPVWEDSGVADAVFFCAAAASDDGSRIE